jgi:hypothetical protein
VSALPARALVAGDRGVAGATAVAGRAQLQAAAPQAVATIHRYLRQPGTFLAPRSAGAAESALRRFARWMVAQTQVTAIAQAGRDDVEDYKTSDALSCQAAMAVVARAAGKAVCSSKCCLVARQWCRPLRRRPKRLRWAAACRSPSSRRRW